MVFQKCSPQGRDGLSTARREKETTQERNRFQPQDIGRHDPGRPPRLQATTVETRALPLREVRSYMHGTWSVSLKFEAFQGEGLKLQNHY